MIKKVWSVALLLAVSVANPALAQNVTVDVSGFGGFYLPVTDFKFADELLPVGVTEATAKQKAAFMFGGRLGLWFSRTFGVEGEFGYALSDIEAKFDGQDICGQLIDGEVFECSANIWLGSVKGVLQYMPQSDAKLTLRLGAGVGAVGRTGKAFEEADGTTDIAGVADVGASFDVSPLVAIRVDAEGYFYSLQIKDASSGLELGDSQFAADLAFTGGVTIKLGR